MSWGSVTHSSGTTGVAQGHKKFVEWLQRQRAPKLCPVGPKVWHCLTASAASLQLSRLP